MRILTASDFDETVLLDEDSVARQVTMCYWGLKIRIFFQISQIVQPYMYGDS